MSILRGFWALFLAGFVYYTFNRSWEWEHGAPMPETIFGGDKPRTKETVVWLDPAVLPLLLLVILVVFGVMDGKDGIVRFLSLSLDIMLVISIYFLLLLFLLPIFRKYFSARACATMWILPVFMFWQAHILLQNAPVPTFVIYIPPNILKVLFPVWVAGFIFVFGGKFISHVIFRHSVMSASVPVSDPEVLEMFDEELKKLEYYHPVRLVISSAITVPLSMGSGKRTRVTVLPNREFTHQELRFIFRHEIHHLQRGDVSTKIFFAFCQALCWFNPLMWVAVRKASDDLELSCDEIVLEDMEEGMRRQYAQLLLNTAGHSEGFTTCLSAAAETMRYRLKHIVTVRKRWPGTLMLSIAMFLCVMSYGTIAVSSSRGTVTELIPECRTAADITGVFYQPDDIQPLRKAFVLNEDQLFSCLASLDAEKLSSPNELHDIGGQRLCVQIEYPGIMEVSIYDRVVKVFRFQFRNNSSTEYFYLRSEPDWDMIIGCLDLNAEEPQEPAVLDPQMRVHFDVDGQDEPITAVRHHFRAWDIETGETLRASENSDPAGGLHGLSPTQAQLVFDMPVSEITVRVKEWDSDFQTTAELDVQEGCYFLLLKNYSAHYQVDVVYEPYDGIRYEGTYVFDVEYPN